MMRMKVMTFLLLAATVVKGTYYDALRRRYSVTEAPDFCPKVVCTDDRLYACSSITNNSLLLCPNCCPKSENSLCIASSTSYKGVCMQKLEFQEPIKGFPGDLCTKDAECLFGPRKCGEQNVCEGVGRFGACKQSADCIFHHFCSYGHCVPILPAGAYCVSSEDCGREAICVFEEDGSSFGTCVRILSLEEGAKVLYMRGNDTVYFEGAEKLCRTGWVEPSDGRCSDGMQSKNAGQICNKNADCATTRTGQYTSCRCGFNNNGTKYCDIEGGNDAWQTARTAFKEYIEGSKNCHNAARWSECGNFELYKKWRCAEFKAMYYVELFNNPSCLTKMYSSIPGFMEMELFCGSSYLGLGLISLIAVLILLL